MNTRQLKYAIELSKTLNFSQVAESLGISQPALSKQILNLEQDLGVKLFDRDSMPIKLTPAGEYFLTEAKQLLLNEEMLLRSMQEFQSGTRGQLTVGATPFRSQYLIPRIAKEFTQRYPMVKLVLLEAGSEQLRSQTAEGKFDLALVNLPVDESVLDVIPIESDILVLAVPERFSGNLPTATSQEIVTIGLETCKDIPFVSVGKHQEMRQLLEKSCAMANFTPTVCMEVTGISTAYAMCMEGIGATLVPLQYVNHLKKPDDLRLFAPRQTLYTRQSAVITRKGQFVSEYARHFIHLLTQGL
ncbi:MAG: LysR family transcriptional regulator [Ruminococcaceae bacterium]|nr:LysR family transcriptional regulator [Oscillospiraceae bacterium]